MIAFCGYVSHILATVLVTSVGENIAGDGQKKAVRALFALILLITVASPIPELLRSAGEELSSITSVGNTSLSETPLSAVAEEAFCRGVLLSLCDKFSFYEKEIEVSVTDFDSTEMTAGVITVTLSGGAALSDVTAVRSFVSESFGGRCHVEISLG